MIILKSRLTLQVILPAHASLVTPSLIDDSARHKYYNSSTKNLYLRSVALQPFIFSVVKLHEFEFQSY